jgi:hypothetical protein
MQRQTTLFKSRAYYVGNSPNRMTDKRGTKQNKEERKEGIQAAKEGKGHSSCSSWGNQTQQLAAPDVRYQI